MKRLSRDDLMDMVVGCTILGTGGGGDPEEGVALIDEALAAGKTFDLVSLDEAPDDALICTPYILGAISELPADQVERFTRLPRTETPPILLAYDAFQKRLGQEFYGTVPCELGGSNTAVAMYAAAMSGHYVIDADPAGRAVPEITHSTYFIHGLPASPIIMANDFGEIITCDNVLDDMRAEDLVRALSMVSGIEIAAIDHALPARQLRNAIVPGTISKAIALGAAHRKAAADWATVVAQAGGGQVVFQGTVRRCDWRTEGGFTLGTIELDGTGDHDESKYKIDLKNENLVAWRDGALHACIPDLICVLDTETGQPVTNPNARAGQKVAVVILPAPEPFLTPKGLEVFGPKYAGLGDHGFVSPLT